MDSTNKIDADKKIDEEILKLIKDPTTTHLSEEQNVTDLSFNLLINSQIYKQPRMNQIMRFERLYNNDVSPKFRQLFNIPVPVFPGMVDSLLSDMNDQVQIKFNPKNTAQYLLAPKVQAQWEAERDSLAPNASWNQKTREDRFNAIISGRGILKNYAENDPEYRNVFEVVNISDFHFQPLGGSILENHLFAGQEGIFITADTLASNPDTYDKEQVKKLLEFAASDKFYMDVDSDYGTKLMRFRSLGLDIMSNTFSGARTFNFCEFIVPWKGKRWYVLFEPNTKTWVRCKPWEELCDSEMYPWDSWATHPDHKNFLSKSYADDLYYVADGIITMFNQELTNREKRNFNSKAFDKDMFTNVAKLDDAQYYPDRLVPVDTLNGARKIQDGIFTFQTAELQGTVDLISFMDKYVGDKTGISSLSQGEAPGTVKKPSVIIAQQQQLAKRIGLRSDNFKECYARVGKRYMEGLKEFMPPSMSIKIIGENGFIEEQELKRIEISRNGDLGISVSSTSEQENADNLKRDGRVKAVETVAQNPNLSKWEKETIYRDVGQFDEEEIGFALDTSSFTSKKQIAKASQACQQILLNKKPDIYYGADQSFVEYIRSYAIDHETQIKKLKKSKVFVDYLTAITPIVQQNVKLQQSKQQAQPPQVGPDGQPVQKGAPAQGGQPQPQPPRAQPAPQEKPSATPVSVAQKMGAMAQ